MSDETVGRPPASEPQGPHAGLEAVAAEILPALIARLRSSHLGELEVRTASWRIRLRRDLGAQPRAKAAGTPAGSEADEPPGSVARSTAVGYFSPGPALIVGATVQAGDVLGTIDVLGIAQEVTAPEDGVVSRILAEEGQAVEFGQELADIEPMVLELEADARDEGAG